MASPTRYWCKAQFKSEKNFTRHLENWIYRSAGTLPHNEPRSGYATTLHKQTARIPNATVRLLLARRRLMCGTMILLHGAGGIPGRGAIPMSSVAAERLQISRAHGVSRTNNVLLHIKIHFYYMWPQNTVNFSERRKSQWTNAKWSLSRTRKAVLEKLQQQQI